MINTLCVLATFFLTSMKWNRIDPKKNPFLPTKYYLVSRVSVSLCPILEMKENRIVCFYIRFLVILKTG